MTIACEIYKGVNKLATGTATAASATIASVSAVSGNVVGPGRNVQVVMVAGVGAGQSYRTRVLADGGTSLTLADAVPFV